MVYSAGLEINPSGARLCDRSREHGGDNLNLLRSGSLFYSIYFVTH